MNGGETVVMQHIEMNTMSEILQRNTQQIGVCRHRDSGDKGGVNAKIAKYNSKARRANCEYDQER